MDPRETHRTRRQQARAVADAARRQASGLAVGRGLAFLAGGLGVWLVWGPVGLPAAWLTLPTLAFMGLVVAHGRADARGRLALRTAEVHQLALDRMAGNWPGVGPAGTRFESPGHPYAVDLDLLGPGSLFQLLCAARTFAGQATLAGWLQAPSAVEDLEDRQGAVRELIPQVDLREAMALAGGQQRMDLDPVALRRWSQTPGWTARHLWSALAALTAVAMIGNLVAWFVWSWPAWPFLGSVVAGYLVHVRVAATRGDMLTHVQVPSVELSILSRLLTLVEAQAPSHPRLVGLHAESTATGRPSRAIQNLGRGLERLDWERNLLFAPLAGLLLWRAQWTIWVESWRLRHGASSERWLQILGEVEALQSLARHAFEHPTDVFPRFSQVLEYRAEGLAHPLLAEDVAVANDVRLDAAQRLLMVSGSNMSGKSTLLRSVGSNAVLALAGGVVRARILHLSPLAVGASIRSQDSLLSGSSRFRAELDRMRAVLDLSTQETPVLFLLDEIFHGTHSHDRRRGAQAFLTRLLERGAMGLVTTHDLALTQLEGDLARLGTNVHFQDEVVEGEMRFDYRMRPGVVAKSNALQLMVAEGLIDPPAP